jgi:NTE family protein
MLNKPSQSIALALSGGGMRAMVFHLGVLQFLAERQLLEKIDRISTVSGGSLVVGLIFQENRLHWPTSSQYLTHVLPTLKEKLIKDSLPWGALRQLRSPGYWRFLVTRANLLAATLKHEWGIEASLEHLPPKPEWSINGTTAETGKRFRFKHDNFGDYSIGYVRNGKFPLASAIAVSAAFPGAFGPLLIDADKMVWLKREWGAPEETEMPQKSKFAKLHLYDGGVYDNLGLEPFFDSGRQKAKADDVFIISSDAGAPLKTGFSANWFNLLRLMRIVDIMSDQTRALRVRAFVEYITRESSGGLFISLNDSGDRHKNESLAKFSMTYATNLNRPSGDHFDLLMRYGYERAQNAFKQHQASAPKPETVKLISILKKEV